MLIFYRLITCLILLLSPIILIIRLLNNKEHIKRFSEKFCFFSEKKNKGKLIWFHGASVGELQSIIPLIEKLEKDKKINQILITSNTLSSSNVIRNYKFKKVTHQFFPIDVNFLSKKFIDYWKPSLALFVDSEIWPNMLINLKGKKIPIILLNGRITKKTFKRWMIFSKFANTLFQKFDLCLPSNSKSIYYLKELGAKKIRNIGNLKYSESERKIKNLKKSLKNFFLSKKVWCASSTHSTEERFCGMIHKKLKIKHKNLLTILIPRHINRIKSIKKELMSMGLNVHIDEPMSAIDKKTDIYLVNSYGKTKSFYNNCKNVFLGGSIINHGGQNPLEAARFGCNILHGKNISNFDEIYEFLGKNKISYLVTSKQKFENKLNLLLSKKGNNSKKIKYKIDKIGKKILNNTYEEINFILKNAI
ncbi:3-deoxy-D-manno-octulosonic acid transferase [Candidatus Pelagibacter communis]|uniref:3-deoxy-D-manno-octulosonic acid transferase n=1 Tax=Pelagibacter ubique TaxID=198252 RepID=UPI00094D47EA|nr:glycosyltransferase N-terminal domain-containing protein [Candidatus Pelagibacter ubique]|tara:strand:- start:303 stop:1559 length:1257 start_codon:yes stop_codon:yes gene_type:complete